MRDDIDFIQRMLPVEELLCQLAEECNELGQAALKLRRALDGTNYTPVSVVQAYEHLDEEVADIILCLNVIGAKNDSNCVARQKKKAKRWASRLRGEIE